MGGISPPRPKKMGGETLDFPPQITNFGGGERKPWYCCVFSWFFSEFCTRYVQPWMVFPILFSEFCRTNVYHRSGQLLIFLRISSKFLRTNTTIRRQYSLVSSCFLKQYNAKHGMVFLEKSRFFLRTVCVVHVSTRAKWVRKYACHAKTEFMNDHSRAIGRRLRSSAQTSGSPRYSISPKIGPKNLTCTILGLTQDTQNGRL